MRALFYLLRAVLRKWNYDLELVNLSKPNPIRLYSSDSRFRDLYNAVQDRTAIGPASMSILYQLARRAATSAGAVAEIGTYKGGSAYLLATVLPHKTIHAFDTFGGMPEVSSHDVIEKGLFMVNAETVLAFLGEKKNIEAHVGVFPETAAPVASETFCLVHIDVDIYQSVRDCLEFFYPRTVSGGIIISDDYGSIVCPGAKKAWDEFFADKKEQSVYLPTGQCLVIKE